LHYRVSPTTKPVTPSLLVQILITISSVLDLQEYIAQTYQGYVHFVRKQNAIPKNSVLPKKNGHQIGSLRIWHNLVTK
jgi:hypothetical protein